MKQNILLYGEGGSGKTVATISCLKLLKKNPKLRMCFLITETNSLLGIRDGLRIHNIDLKEKQLYYKLCKPRQITSISTKQMAEDFETNFMDISETDSMKVKIETSDRKKHNTFLEILKGMGTYTGTDYFTGEKENLGDYLKWEDNTIFVVDSLTAAVDYLVDVVIANRVSVIVSDYKTVQQNLMRKIIVPLTELSKCSIIMIGHPTIGEDNTVKQPKKKEDKITKLYPRTFGQAINSTLISKFTETVYCYVDTMDNFYWAGKKLGIATSTRSIPRKDKLEPDFSKYEVF